jgi:hypothetical protein
MRQCHEDDIACLQPFDRAELQLRPLAQVWMNEEDELAGISLRRHLSKVDSRMAQQEPDQLAARITRTADDRYV